MKIKKRKEKKQRMSKAPIAILALGLLAIGFTPFKAIKKHFKKAKKRRRTLAA